MKYYTGIGSRQTPAIVLNVFKKLATELETDGYVLRSGGANGADTAFEAGVSNVKNKQIFLPWKNFNNNESNLTYDYEFAINKLNAVISKSHLKNLIGNPAVLKLHLRNVHQIYGCQSCEKTSFVVCWTEDANVVGGTATAIKLANKENIPVYNFGKYKKLNEFEEFAQKILDRYKVVQND